MRVPLNRLWQVAANDNLPEDEWSWEVIMLLSHSTREERWVEL